MTFLIPIIIVLMICFLIVGYRNRYTYFLLLMSAAIIGMLYSTFSLIYKTGYYNQISTVLGKLDSRFFFLISKRAPEFYTLFRNFNISLALYFVASVFFVRTFLNEKKWLSSEKKLYGIFSMFAFPTWYVVFYDPKVMYHMYLALNNTNMPIPRAIIIALDIMNYIMIVVYLALPIVTIHNYLKDRRTYIRKRQTIFVTLCVILLNILFILVFAIGIYREPFYFNLNIIAVKQMNSAWGKNGFMILIIVMLVILLMIYYILGKYSVTSRVGIIKQMIFKNNLKKMNKNYISVFHSVKNVVFSYKLLLEMAKSKEGEEKQKILDELENKIDDYVKHISMMLDFEDANIEIELEQTNYKTLVNYAIEKAIIEDNIKIEKKVNEDMFIEVDTMFMVEAIVNIINNASEAIKKTKKKNGVILFETDTDGEWSVLKITDNGIGMTKREISNLFKPFYTTKSRVKNWGVGLSYTYKIISMHNGILSVDSTPKEQTTFYVYLPMLTK